MHTVVIGFDERLRTDEASNNTSPRGDNHIGKLRQLPAASFILQAYESAFQGSSRLLVGYRFSGCCGVHCTHNYIIADI